jgi:hypothetical protein
MVIGAEGVDPWGRGRVVEGASEGGVGELCWLDPRVAAEVPGESGEWEADDGEDVNESLRGEPPWELPGELLAEEFLLWEPACDPDEAERFLEEEAFFLEEDFPVEEGAGDFLGLLELEEL